MYNHILKTTIFSSLAVFLCVCLFSKIKHKIYHFKYFWVSNSVTLSTFTFLCGHVYYTFCPHSNYTHFFPYPVKISPIAVSSGVWFDPPEDTSVSLLLFHGCWVWNKEFYNSQKSRSKSSKFTLVPWLSKSQRVTQKGPGGPQGARRQMQWVSVAVEEPWVWGIHPFYSQQLLLWMERLLHPFRLLAENTTPGNGLGRTGQDVAFLVYLAE